MFAEETTDTQQTATSSTTTTCRPMSSIYIPTVPLPNSSIQQPVAVSQPPPPDQIITQLTQNRNLTTKQPTNNTVRDYLGSVLE